MENSKKRRLSDENVEASPEKNQSGQKRAKSDSSEHDDGVRTHERDCSQKISNDNSCTNAQNVRVVARLRPLSAKERNEQSEEAIKADPKLSTMKIYSDRTFEYDAVFDPSVTQRQMYEKTVGAAVKSNIFKGFNVTILAYGQTGSGKTFTMGTSGESRLAGDNHDDEKKEVNKVDLSSFLPPAEGDGIIPRAVHDLFETRSEMKCGKENVKVRISYLEIYNEEVRDLLSSDPSSSSNLYIRDSKEGVSVQNLVWEEVTTPAQVTAMMDAAAHKRATASTQMNAVSSRSHAICTLHVTVAPLTGHDDGEASNSTAQESITAKLTLVDLAGSERIKRTGAEGSRMKEGININKGLFVLGQVVSSLSQLGQDGQSSNSNLHVPYRDSKLTRLLQDSLGGNSRTIMVACISPADSNVEESLNTLRYAQRARNIKNVAVRNVVASAISPAEALALRRENKLLKLQVLQLQSKLHAMQPSLLPLVKSSEEVSKSDLDGSVGGLNVANLEILTRFRAKCASQETRIEQLQDACTSAAEDALTASLRADRAAIKFEELIAIAKSQGVDIPINFGLNEEKHQIADKLREEVSDLKSALRNALSDAVVARATAATVVAELSTPQGTIAASEQAGLDDVIMARNVDSDNGKLVAELEAVTFDIEQKETMAEKLRKERELHEAMRIHFEGALQSLQDEVDALSSERQQLLGNVSQKREASTDQLQGMRQRTKELEARIKELQAKAAEHKKCLRRAKQAEDRCVQLSAEIQADKKRRTTLQRKLKEESAERRSEKKAAQLHAARLLRDSQKLKYEMQKIKDAAARQVVVLRRKAAEATSRERKAAEQQRKRKLAASMKSKPVSSNGSNEDLVAWFDREIETALTRLQTKQQIEEHKTLLEEAIERRSELENSSGLDSASGRALDSQIEMRHGIIKQLERTDDEFQQSLSSTSGNHQGVQQPFQETAVWNSLTRANLKSLFPTAFGILVGLKCELNKLQRHQSESVAEACSRAVAVERRRAEELVMKLKLENSEAMAALMASTKAAVEHEAKCTLMSGDDSKSHTLDSMMKTYLEGFDRVEARVKDDLAYIKKHQDCMKQLMNNVANEIISKTEDKTVPKSCKTKSKKKHVITSDEGFVEQAYEAFAFEDDEDEVDDGSDDSDWSPDTPARKKRKPNSPKTSETEIVPATSSIQNTKKPDEDAANDCKSDEIRDINSLKVAELREMLRELSLPVSGKKAELILRLRAHQLDSAKFNDLMHEHDKQAPAASGTENSVNIDEIDQLPAQTASVKLSESKCDQENQYPEAKKEYHPEASVGSNARRITSNKEKRKPLATRTISTSNIQKHTPSMAAPDVRKRRGHARQSSKINLKENRRRRKSMRMAVNKTLLDLEKLQATL